MAWIVLESIEAEPADVVQGNASDAVEDGVEVPDLATCRLSYLVSTCCLVESENTVETPEHGERQDDLAVLRLLVIAPEKSAMPQIKLVISLKL